MKHKIKNTLRDIAKYLGLKVKFVSYFSNDIHGKLLPREKRILINAHKPRCEHVFTLFHEIAHYMLHFKGSLQRKHYPWFLDRHWKLNFAADIASKIRRYIRFIYNKESGKEWEANLLAMILFLCFAKFVGSSDDLIAFLNRHPEKNGIFLLAVFAVAYGRIKTRAINFIRLLNPVKAP